MSYLPVQVAVNEISSPKRVPIEYSLCEDPEDYEYDEYDESLLGPEEKDIVAGSSGLGRIVGLDDTEHSLHVIGETIPCGNQVPAKMIPRWNKRNDAVVNRVSRWDSSSKKLEKPLNNKASVMKPRRRPSSKGLSKPKRTQSNESMEARNPQCFDLEESSMHLAHLSSDRALLPKTRRASIPVHSSHSATHPDSTIATLNNLIGDSSHHMFLMSSSTLQTTVHENKSVVDIDASFHIDQLPPTKRQSTSVSDCSNNMSHSSFATDDDYVLEEVLGESNLDRFYMSTDSFS